MTQYARLPMTLLRRAKARLLQHLVCNPRGHLPVSLGERGITHHHAICARCLSELVVWIGSDGQWCPSPWNSKWSEHAAFFLWRPLGTGGGPRSTLDPAKLLIVAADNTQFDPLRQMLDEGTINSQGRYQPYTPNHIPLRSTFALVRTNDPMRLGPTLITTHYRSHALHRRFDYE